MESSEINSKCLLCQNSIEEAQAHPSWMTSVYSAWNESCAISLCQLFNLSVDPFQNVFLEAGYCSTCRQLIRDIDFATKSISCLQQKLNNSRESVEALLRENYEKIKAIEDEIKEEPLDSDFLNFASSSLSNSYGSTVKLIYDTVAGCTTTVKPVIVSVSSLGRQKKSRARKSRVVSVVSANEDYNTVDYEKLTAGSSSLKREIPSYRYADLSDTEPQQNYYGCDSDFMPKVELILPDRDSDSADDKHHSGIYLNSISADPDSEVTSFPKKANARTKNEPAKKPKKRRKSNPNPTGVINKNLSNNIKYKCTFEAQCTFTTRALIKLQAHINGVHKGDKKPFHCETCKEASKEHAFGSATSYYYHQQKQHSTSEPTIFCDICKKPFIAKWELTKHKAVAHAEINSKLRCLHCKKMFDEDKPDELSQHEALHKSKLKPFACVLCDKEDYTNTYDLSIHVGQEHEELSFKCETCNRAFNTERKLRRHIFSVHVERNPALQCTQCPFKALCPSALTRHLDWHSNKRNCQCDKCPNSYKSQSCLNHHMRVAHGKDRAYKCNLCDKSFGARSQLKTHEDIHYTYYCEICGKALMGKKNLGQHMRVHANKAKDLEYRSRYTNTTALASARNSTPEDGMSVACEDEMDVE